MSRNAMEHIGAGRREKVEVPIVAIALRFLIEDCKSHVTTTSDNFKISLSRHRNPKILVMSYILKTANLLKFQLDVDSKVLLPQISSGLEKTKRSLQLSRFFKNFKESQKITFKTNSRCKSGSQRSRRVKPRSGNMEKRKKDQVISENCVKEKLQKIDKKNKDVTYIVGLSNNIAQMTKAKAERNLHERNKITTYFYRPNNCYACSSRQRDAKKRLEGLQQRRFYSQYNASRKIFVRDIFNDETAQAPSQNVDIEACRSSLVPLYLLVKSSTRSNLRRLSSTRFKYLIGSSNAIVDIAHQRAHSDTEIVKKSVRDTLKSSNMTEISVWKPKMSFASLNPKISNSYLGERYLASNNNRANTTGNDLYYKVKKSSSKELTDTISESLKPILQGEQVRYNEIKEAIKHLEDKLNCYFERIAKSDHRGQLEIPEPSAGQLQRSKNFTRLAGDERVNMKNLKFNHSYGTNNSCGRGGSGNNKGKSVTGRGNDRSKEDLKKHKQECPPKSKQTGSSAKVKEGPSCNNLPKEKGGTKSKSDLTRNTQVCRDKAFEKSKSNDTAKCSGSTHKFPKEEVGIKPKSNITKDTQDCRDKNIKANDTAKCSGGKDKQPESKAGDKSDRTLIEKCRRKIFAATKKTKSKNRVCKGKDYKELLTPYQKHVTKTPCKKEKEENPCRGSQKPDPCKQECSGDTSKDPCKQEEDSCKSKKAEPRKNENTCKSKGPCRKEDTCKSKDPCKQESDPCKSDKPDPCKKEDPCKSKDPCKMDDPSKSKDPCKQASDPCKSDKLDPCKQKDPCKSKDPCKHASDPCKSDKPDPCKKEDPCKSKDPCKMDDPCKSKDPCKQASDPCKSDKLDPCKQKDPCKSKDPCKQASDPCKSDKPDPCKKEDPCKSKDPCKMDDPCKSKDPCKQASDPCKSDKLDPCKQKDPCKSKDPCKEASEPCKSDKPDPCKKEDTCKSKDPCKMDDPCKGKDPCKQASDPCKSDKPDPCEKDDPCKTKDTKTSEQIDCRKSSADRRAKLCSKKSDSETCTPAKMSKKPKLAPGEIKCELKKATGDKGCCKDVKLCEEDRIKRAALKCETKEAKKCAIPKETCQHDQALMPEDRPLKITVPQEESPECLRCSTFLKPCNASSPEPKTPPNVCKPKPEKILEAPKINEEQQVLRDKPDLTQKPCTSQQKVKTLKASIPLKPTKEVKKTTSTKKVCKKPSAEDTRYCPNRKREPAVPCQQQQQQKQPPEKQSKGACIETGKSTPKQMPKKLWKPIKIGGSRGNEKHKKSVTTPTKGKTRSYCQKSTLKFNTIPLLTPKPRAAQCCNFRELINEQKLQYYRRPKSKQAKPVTSQPCYDTIPLIIPRPKRMKASQMSIKELIELTCTPKEIRYCQNPKSKTCVPLPQETDDDHCDLKPCSLKSPMGYSGEVGQKMSLRRHSDGKIRDKCEEEMLPRRHSASEVCTQQSPSNNECCTMRQTAVSPWQQEEIVESVCKEVLQNTPRNIEEAIEEARRLCTEKILAATECQRQLNPEMSAQAQPNQSCCDSPPPPQNQDSNACEVETKCESPSATKPDSCLMKPYEQPVQSAETALNLCTADELIVVGQCEPVQPEETECLPDINSNDFLSKRKELGGTGNYVTSLKPDTAEAVCEESENFIPMKRCRIPEGATEKQHPRRDWKPVKIEGPKPVEQSSPVPDSISLESPKLSSELPKRKGGSKGLTRECKDFASRVYKALGNKKTKTTSAHGLQRSADDPSSYAPTFELSRQEYVPENFVYSLDPGKYPKDVGTGRNVETGGEFKNLDSYTVRPTPEGKQKPKKVSFKLLHHDYIFLKNKLSTKNKGDSNKTIDAYFIREMSTFNRNHRKSTPSVLCTKILKKSTIRDKYPWNSLKNKEEKRCPQSYITEKSYESKDKSKESKYEDILAVCKCNANQQKVCSEKQPKQEDPCRKRNKETVDCAAPKAEAEKRKSKTCDGEGKRKNDVCSENRETSGKKSKEGVSCNAEKKQKEVCSSKSKREDPCNKEKKKSAGCFVPKTEEEKKKYRTCDGEEKKKKDVCSENQQPRDKKSKEDSSCNANKKKDVCSSKSKTEDPCSKERKKSTDSPVPKIEEKKKFKACAGEDKKRNDAQSGKSKPDCLNNNKSKESVNCGGNESKKKDLCSLRSKIEDLCGKKGKESMDCNVTKTEEEKKKFRASDGEEKKRKEVCSEKQQKSKEAINCNANEKKGKDVCSSKSKTEDLCSKERKKSADCFVPKTEEEKKKYRICDGKDKKTKDICSEKRQPYGKKSTEAVNYNANEKKEKDVCSSKSKTEDPCSKERKTSADCFVPKTVEEKKKFKACDGEDKNRKDVCSENRQLRGKKSKEAINCGVNEKKHEDLCSLKSKTEDPCSKERKKSADCFVPKTEDKKKFKACDGKAEGANEVCPKKETCPRVEKSKEAMNCSESTTKKDVQGVKPKSSNLVCGEKAKESVAKSGERNQGNEVCSTKPNRHGQTSNECLEQSRRTADSCSSELKDYNHPNLMCGVKSKGTKDGFASETKSKKENRICYEEAKINIEKCLKICKNQGKDECSSNDKGQRKLGNGEKKNTNESCSGKTRSKSESTDTTHKTDCKAQGIDSQKQVPCESEPTHVKKKPKANPCMTPVRVVSLSEIYKTKKSKSEGSIHKQCKDCSSVMITSADKIAAVEKEMSRLDQTKDDLLFCKVMKTGRTERMVCKTQQQWEKADPKREEIRHMDRIVQGKLDQHTDTLICKEVRLDVCEKTGKDAMKRRATQPQKVMTVGKMLVCNEKMNGDTKELECEVKRVKEIKTVEKWSDMTAKKGASKRKNTEQARTDDGKTTSDESTKPNRRPCK